jgi:hypothetical protein
LPAPINTAGAEDAPFITPDGQKLFFFFTPDISIPPHKQLVDGVTGIYVAEKKENGWDIPHRIILQDSNKVALDGAPCVQDKMLWFCSARKQNIERNIEFHIAEWTGDKWARWRNAGRRLNVEIKVGELHVMPGGREIYFHSDRKGGKGKLDIWITRLVGDNWSEPENAGEVNSPENDAQPYLSPNGEELWFTRVHEGTPGTWRSRKTGGVWTKPELIASRFAGEPAVDAEGNLYFVHHFLKDRKIVEADIYFARKKKQ